MSKKYNPPDIRLEIPFGVKFKKTRDTQRIMVGDSGHPEMKIAPLPSYAHDMPEEPVPLMPPRDELFNLTRQKVVFRLYAVEEEIWDEDNDTKTPSTILGYVIQVAQRLYLPPQKHHTFTVPLTITPYQDE